MCDFLSQRLECRTVIEHRETFRLHFRNLSAKEDPSFAFRVSSRLLRSFSAEAQSRQDPKKTKFKEQLTEEHPLVSVLIGATCLGCCFVSFASWRTVRLSGNFIGARETRTAPERERQGFSF